MKTEIALSMKDTNRFMWMKLRVQCSFLREPGWGGHEFTVLHTLRVGLLWAYSWLVLMGSLSQTTLFSHLNNPLPSPPGPSSGQTSASCNLSTSSLPRLGRLKQAKEISGRDYARPCGPGLMSCPLRPLPICCTMDRACLPRDFPGILGWTVLTLTLLGSHRKRHKMTMAVVRVTRDVL